MERLPSPPSHDEQKSEGLALSEVVLAQNSPTLWNDAASIVSFLLSDWSNFGRCDRTFYHLELIGSSQQQQYQNLSQNQRLSITATEESTRSDTGTCCGVVGLLECVPLTPLNKRTRRYRRHFREKIRAFPKRLGNCASNNGGTSTSCHRPIKSVPLPVSNITRVTFAYELTNIVVCIDASPSLTMLGSSESSLCAIDNLGPMLRTYLTSLVSPFSSTTSWTPNLAITVLAVFPQESDSMVLVKDYRVHDLKSSQILSDRVENWVLREVEDEIATKLCNSKNSGCGPHSFSNNYTSDLRQMLQVCSVALGTLPPTGRPTVVIVTDCNSVLCGNVMEFVSAAAHPLNSSQNSTTTMSCAYVRMEDVPIHVLNVSPTQPSSISSSITHLNKQMSPSLAPFQISDDTHALSRICEVSHGCLITCDSLNEMTKTVVGQVPASSPLYIDNFVSSRKKRGGSNTSMKPNVLQWYTLFNLSSLTPLMNHTLWGWMAFLPAYAYRSKRTITSSSICSGALYPSQEVGIHSQKGKEGMVSKKKKESTEYARDFTFRHDNVHDSRENNTGNQIKAIEALSTSPTFLLNHHDQSLDHTVIHSYSLSPIRIRGLLFLRIQQNFRAKYFGGEHHDEHTYGKVSIHFTLPLDFGVTLHYELSFTPTLSQTIGWAQIKLSLSGGFYFIHDIKDDFTSRLLSGQKSAMMHHHPTNSSSRFPVKHRSMSIARRASAKICKFLFSIKSEDELEKGLCCSIVEEFNLLQTKESEFLLRLDSLTLTQRYYHFQVETFQVLSVTNGPETGVAMSKTKSTVGDSKHINTHAPNPFSDMTSKCDSNGGELFHLFSSWWAQVVTKEGRFIKIMSTVKHSLAAYSMVEIIQSKVASGMFHVSVSFFGIHVEERLLLLSTILDRLHESEHFVVLPHFVQDHNLITHGNSNHNFNQSKWMEKLCHHEKWNLDYDYGLLPLLIHRRVEIEQFWLLESSDSHATFIKYYQLSSDEESDRVNCNCLLQNQIYVHGDCVVVHLYMDIPSGIFQSRYFDEGNDPKGQAEIKNRAREVKNLDEQCANSLRSRSRLLSVFNAKELPIKYFPSFQAHDVNRLLSYSYRLKKDLRFFHSCAGNTNDVLFDLTSDFLLSLEDPAQEQKIIKLGIGSSECVGEIGPGRWFLMQHSLSIHSIIYFANTIEIINDVNKPESSKNYCVFREISFFTFGTHDLYHNDTKNRDVKFGSYSRKVHRIMDSIESEHDLNFARSTFLALRMGEGNIERSNQISFHPDDFSYGMTFLSDIEIADSIIMTPVAANSPMYNSVASIIGIKTMASTLNEKLVKVIDSLFTPVPGEGLGSFFYFSGLESEDLNFCNNTNTNLKKRMSKEEIILIDSDSESGDDEFDENCDRSFLDEHFSHFDNDIKSGHHFNDNSLPNNKVSPQSISTQPSQPHTALSPPIFVKFVLNGKTVKRDDIIIHSRSSSFKAYITVFNSSKKFAPFSTDLPLHSSVALALKSRLDSFVASLTLDHLHEVTTSMFDFDMKTALKSAIAAESTLSIFPLVFFVCKSDSLEPVSTPSINENDISTGMLKLFAEFDAGRLLKFQKGYHNTYFVTSTQDSSDLFWAFVQIQPARGFVSTIVYHPGGIIVAERTRSYIQSIVEKMCHRVNQLLLLESMHNTRQASRFMLPLEEKCLNGIQPKTSVTNSFHRVSKNKTAGNEEAEDIYDFLSPKNDGIFSCSIVFKERFVLNHRCKMSQTIIDLESSILHPFAISNRNGRFVYKDKTGHIFYMQLEANYDVCAEEECNDVILFLVYGIDKPDESITVQLPRLLRKKMISLSVNVLSSVLQKNPHFHLLEADVIFIRSFQDALKQIEPSNSQNERLSYRDYEFPESVYDPILVLMYFRQNIIGSSHFHRLQEVSIEGQSETSNDSTSSSLVRSSIKSGLKIQYNQRDFRIYYNNAPSPLNPNLQPVSTLTSKGAFFSRQCGSGIAFIDFILLDKAGNYVETAFVGATPSEVNSVLRVPEEYFILRQLNSNRKDQCHKLSSGFRLRVNITNTTLDLSILHEWIELTLNQALAGWYIERHLERMRLNFLIPCADTFQVNEEAMNIWNDTETRTLLLEKSITGLPFLHSVLSKMYSFPSPTVELFKLSCRIPSSAVSHLTLDIMEQAILGSLHDEKITALEDHREISIIRLQKSEAPKLVTLSRVNGNKVRVNELTPNQKKNLNDSNSPEYICFCALPNEQLIDTSSGNQNKRLVKPSMLLFNKVIADGEAGSIASALSSLKAAKPSVFIRSIAFVVFITRTSQTILTYNWNPRVLHETNARLKEIERETIQVERNRVNILQKRCLGNLSALYRVGPMNSTENDVKIQKGKSHETHRGQLKQTKDSIKSAESRSAQTLDSEARIKKNTESTLSSRKYSSPAVIKRPKLIGRSEKGAAAQAVLASRARASSRSVKSGSKYSGHDHLKKNKASKEKHTSSDVTREKNLLISKDSTKHGDSANLATTFSKQDTNVCHKKEESTKLTLALTSGSSKRLTSPKCSWSKNLQTITSTKTLSSSKIISCDCLPCFIDAGVSINDLIRNVTNFFVNSFPNASYINTINLWKADDARLPKGEDSVKHRYSRAPMVFFDSKDGNYLFILRFQLEYSQLSRKHVFSCQTWIAISKNLKTKIKGIQSTIKLEKKICNMTSLIDSSLINTSFSVAMFNFSVAALKQATRFGDDTSKKWPAATTLLRQISRRYSLQQQFRLPGVSHVLYHKKTYFPAPLLSVSTGQELLKNVSERTISYGIKDCSCAGEICISKSLENVNQRASLYVMLNEEDKDAFDLFVLCTTEDGILDGFVTKDKTIYSITWVDYIMIMAAREFQRYLNSAVTHLRRNHQA